MSEPLVVLSNAARNLLSPLSEGGRTLGPDEIRKYVEGSRPLAELSTGHSFATEEVDAIVRDLEALFVVEQGRSVSLVGENRPPQWYVGDRRSPGAFTSRYLLKLGDDGWAPRSIEELSQSTADVMALMDDPSRPGDWHWRGLVVGNVQSGKTAHYAGLMARAADAGYRVIIVLAGMHKVLRRQTQLRLDADFLGYDTVQDKANGGQRRNIGVGRLLGTHPLVDSLTTSEIGGDFGKVVARGANFTPAERPFVFVIKKNASILRNLNTWIGRLPAEAKSVPLLVIDDEADQASPDTGDQEMLEDGTFDEDYEPKRINREIRTLLSGFDRSVYVGYTATPFANILIHDERAAADYGADLFPASFITSLSAPDNYFGPVAVFGTDDDIGSPALPLVRHLDQSGEDWIPETHDKSLRPRFDGLPMVPPSLALAIRSFLLSSAARSARGQARKHKSMLVHVSRFQDVHDEVHTQVTAELRALAHAIESNDPEEIGRLERLWRDDFEPTTVEMAMTSFGRGLRTATWDQVRDGLFREVGKIGVVVANGRSKAGIDYEQAAETGLSVIAIGGDKLSRGLTLEGLSTSYFLRASKQYDSLLQMGRWFGYRPGYADLCRLYTTPDMEGWFRHIATVNEQLREQLVRMRINGATPKDYGLDIAMHSVMAVTAANKRRHAIERKISYAGEGKIQTVLYRDREHIELNAAAVERTLAQLGPPEVDRPRPGGRGPAVGLLWSDVASQHVIRLLRELAFPSDIQDVDGRPMADYIVLLNGEGELVEWTVFVPGGSGAYTTIAGHQIKRVLRKSLPEMTTSDLFRFKSILSPLDQAVDLDENHYRQALDATREARAMTTGKLPTRPSGPSIRAKRPSLKGLLIIYPMETVPAVATDRPVFGVVVSFPASSNAPHLSRLDNPVRYRELL